MMPSPLLSSLLGLLVGMAPVVSTAQTIQAPGLVETLHQSTQETFDDFVDRVAVRMSQHAGTTGFEACGNICARTDGPLSSVMVFTGASQIACPILKGCPLGPYADAGEYIHSHPHTYSVMLNAQDALATNENRWLFKKRSGRKMLVNPNMFSKDDYELGPGYMVYKNLLWYQNGKGTARMIRTLSP